MSDATSDHSVDPCLTAAAAYLVGFLTGALVLWRYREIEFAAFHAWQSILFTVFVMVVVVGVATVPIAGPPLAIGAFVIGGVTWLVLVVQAYRGRWTMLPLIGDVAYERSRRKRRDDRARESD